MDADEREKSMEPACNPSMPEDLNDDLKVLKGDAIGDTLYSERWVLKTLITLLEFEEHCWNDDFEKQLCSLWDMTLEKDVVTFLVDKSMFTIIGSVITRTDNDRFLEILIGIIGNMCCVDGVRCELLKNCSLVSELLRLFSREEPPILIQLVRILNSIAWDLVRDSDLSAAWLEDKLNNTVLKDHLLFILVSSKNVELLSCVLELFNTLFGLEINDKDFSIYFCNSDMMTGLIECWNELFETWSPDEDFPSKQLRKTACHWMNVLNSFTGYISGRGILGIHALPLVAILKRIISRPDCVDDILTSAVSVLESILDVYFEGSVLEILLRHMKNISQGIENATWDKSEEYVAQNLYHTIEMYCTSVSLKVERGALQESLSRCPEDLVAIFWKTARKLQGSDPGERAI